MNILTKTALILTAVMAAVPAVDAGACTRVVYAGKNGNVVTGRTLDWRTPIPTSLRIMPRGVSRVSYDSPEGIQWVSRYGSVVSIGYDMGVSEGLNEKGLCVNCLYLPGTVYTKPDETRRKMSSSVWVMYVLDNFATVDEAVAELGKDRFYIDAPAMPEGSAATLHMAISDATGNNAIIEYIDGALSIHTGSQYNVLTNAPTYDKQLAVRDYWKEVGGMNMLPGTNRSSDRFTRASFYESVLPDSLSNRDATAAVFGIIRNCSVPMCISVPGQPEISTTQWRSLADQLKRIYYFELTLSPSVVWVDLTKADLSQGASERSITLTTDGSLAGDITAKFRKATPFKPFFHI